MEDINPHRFRHTFGTEVTRRGVDLLFSKELMGIKSDCVFQRYTKGVFKQVAAEAYLKVIGENSEGAEFGEIQQGDHPIRSVGSDPKISSVGLYGRGTLLTYLETVSKEDKNGYSLATHLISIMYSGEARR